MVGYGSHMVAGRGQEHNQVEGAAADTVAVVAAAAIVVEVVATSY